MLGLGQHRMGEIRHHHAQPLVVDVDPDGGTRCGVQADEGPRSSRLCPPAGSGRFIDLADEARTHEVADDVRDGGSGQQGLAGELGTGHRAVLLEQPQDPSPVPVAKHALGDAPLHAAESRSPDPHLSNFDRTPA
jgi:hypothetical protein